ncbi:hypothetical protein [Glycomyces paridis]|uniref:Uncharacterized protein n=1 Tax=Glycomyces paridis TaxID=2126555 RepID=A0A4S8PA36_9ACTN|nr:hypothetical protein [Glycomyces paridis]THV27128.1 hypothetical protein E9998_16845 [Glycomyces paridis]
MSDDRRFESDPPPTEFKVNGGDIQNLIQVGTVHHLHVGVENRGCDHDGECGPSIACRCACSGPRAEPFDLPQLRAWIARIMVDLQGSSGDHEARRAHLAAAYADTSDARPAAHKNMVRKLVVSGIAAYLVAAEPVPTGPVPEQVLLDLIVFGMWPVITARKLPPQWQGELAELTSPRVAALVAQARRSKTKDRDLAVEHFAAAVAARSLANAVANLFEDLADPRRGGALLLALFAAGRLGLSKVATPEGPFPHLPKDPSPADLHRTARSLLLWALGIATGVAATEAVRHHAAIEEFAEGVLDGFTLPTFEVHPSTVASWLTDPEPGDREAGTDESGDSDGGGSGSGGGDDLPGQHLVHRRLPGMRLGAPHHRQYRLHHLAHPVWNQE